MQLPQIQASPSWMASTVASVYALPSVGKDECPHFQPDKAHTSKFLQPWDLDRSATHVRPDLPRRHRRADVPASWAADLFSVENSNAGAGDSCFPTICQSWRVFLCKCGAVLSELSAVLAPERWWEAGPRTGNRARPRWLSSHHGRHGSLRQRWLWQDKCSRYSRRRWKTNVRRWLQFVYSSATCCLPHSIYRARASTTQVTSQDIGVQHEILYICSSY